MRKLLAALAAAFLLPAAPASAAPTPTPRVAVDRTSVKAGDTLTVRLSGWAAGNVVVELCGNSARRGTADCALTTSATTYVAAKKTTTVLLTVAKPPIGCPCVVSARPVTGGTPVTTSVSVAGVGTLAEPETGGVTSSRSLTVTNVSVTGSGIGTWFGGPAHRTLRFTVRNDGQTAITDAPLSLAAGRGSDPTTIVTAPPLGTLQPGQERSYTTRFTLDGPTFGRYTVRGEITGIDEPIAFTGSTSTYPWAYPVIGALLVLLAFVRALRRPARPPALPADPPTADRVISMNQVVAANVGHWRRVRDLDPALMAESLTRLTGRPWSPTDLANASVDTTTSYTANDLLALSRVLSVPLPALLLPPTDHRYRIAAADPNELAEQISVDGVELLRTVAPTDDPAYTDQVTAINKTFLG